LLIASGDWTAVGATAALLTAASDSQSEASVGPTTTTRGSRDRRSSDRRSLSSNRDAQSVDAERAAELDRLVDVGDWEGVVAAAAKFDAQTTTPATIDDVVDAKGGGDDDKVGCGA
jgi:hypothetical protein